MLAAGTYAVVSYDVTLTNSEDIVLDLVKDWV